MTLKSNSWQKYTEPLFKLLLLKKMHRSPVWPTLLKMQSFALAHISAQEASFRLFMELII